MTDLLQPPAVADEPNVFLVRAHALMLDRKPKADDGLMEKIREHVGSAIEPKDVYPFRMVAASDGVDSYWTQHDLDDSLKPMAGDLKRGQSLLGNHDYETFAYGSSVDGQVVRANTSSPVYEESFFRGRKVPDALKTQHWLVGDYYMVRGLTLNGQETDSIIKGMELGAIRKASISFMVDQYLCGLDGLDMAGARLFGSAATRALRHELDAETVCKHLPGMDYPEGLAWAIMHGSQLIETSLVYKNASPSSLLLRKAEELARMGLLNAQQLSQAEVQFGVRLPSFERKAWASARKEDDVSERSPEAEAEDVEQTTIEPAAPELAEGDVDIAELPVEDQTGEQEEGDTETTEETTAETVVEAFVAASSAVRSALAADLLGSDEIEAVTAATATIDRDLAPRTSNAVSLVAGRQADVQRQTRDREVEEALGRPITVEAIRTLRADAELGAQLFELMVQDTIAARNGLGGTYDADGYGRLLRASRSIEFVKAEKASYDALKAEKFKPGRQVTPGSVREEKASKKAPVAPARSDDDNILAPRAQK